MACISLPTAVLGGSLLSGAGSLAGGIMNSNAAQSAAQQQAQAAEIASADQMSMFGQVQQELHPYVQMGKSAAGSLEDLTGTGKGGNPLTAALTAPFQPTMAQLSKTPGYQFTLQQGEQATQNAAAAQGLGQSGAALKGASQYAEGLASTTYQQQFQNYLSQNQQIYNMVAGQVNTGENAAAQTGSMGLQAQNTASNYATSAAAAQAAGTVGSTSQLAGGLTGATSSLANAGLLFGLTGGMQNGIFGNTNNNSMNGLDSSTTDTLQDYNDYGYMGG